jgi:phosphoglycolate phosphatase-like HAD superfamily hydrolase
VNVIFDFDGTLVDSMPFLEKAAIAVIRHYYNVDRDWARLKYRRSIGLPFETQLVEAFGWTPVQINAIPRFEFLKARYYRAHAKPFKDVVDVLTELATRGIRRSVVSSTKAWMVKDFCERYALPVSDICGNDTGDDKAEQIMALVKAHGPAKFYGDALRDANYARAAGVPFIGIVGTFTPEEFRRAGLLCMGSLRGVLW